MPTAGTHDAASSKWRHTSSGGRPLFAASQAGHSWQREYVAPCSSLPVVALFVEAAQQRDLHLRIQAHVVLPSARAAGETQHVSRCVGTASSSGGGGDGGSSGGDGGSSGGDGGSSGGSASGASAPGRGMPRCRGADGKSPPAGNNLASTWRHAHLHSVQRAQHEVEHTHSVPQAAWQLLDHYRKAGRQGSGQGNDGWCRGSWTQPAAATDRASSLPSQGSLGTAPTA